MCVSWLLLTLILSMHGSTMKRIKRSPGNIAPVIAYNAVRVTLNAYKLLNSRRE